MKYYIDADGVLTPFEKLPLVSEKYITGKKNVNKQVVADINNLLQTIVTNGNMLYLHPRHVGSVGSIAETVFSRCSPFNEEILINCLQNNRDNDYYAIACIEYEAYGVCLRVLTLEEEDYNRLFRLHLIDTFLADN